MSAADIQSVRSFFRDWAKGKVLTSEKKKLPFPSYLAAALADGYQAYYETDKQLPDNPHPRHSGHWWCWRMGWIQAFNEHLFPERAVIG